MVLLPGDYTLCCCAIKALEQSFVGDRREQSTHLFFHCNYCFCLERHTGWSIEEGYCSLAVLFVCWLQELSDVEVISDYSNLMRIWVKSTSQSPNLPTMRPTPNLHVQFPYMRNTLSFNSSATKQIQYAQTLLFLELLSDCFPISFWTQGLLIFSNLDERSLCLRIRVDNVSEVLYSHRYNKSS